MVPETSTQRLAAADIEHHLPVTVVTCNKQTELEASASPRLFSQCLTPDLAFNQATYKHAEFVEVLIRYGWEGSYRIQATFREEVIRLGSGVLQEIRIILDSELDTTIADQVAVIFDPFLVTIRSPESVYFGPMPPGADVWDFWERSGIFRPNNSLEPPQPDGAALIDKGDQSREKNGDDMFLNNNGSGNQGSQGNNDGSVSGSSGAGSNTSISSMERPSTAELKIPFGSMLTCIGHQSQTLFRFKTEACMEIKVVTVLKRTRGILNALL